VAAAVTAAAVTAAAATAAAAVAISSILLLDGIVNIINRATEKCYSSSRPLPVIRPPPQ
jgi:hypothetical protein